MVDKMQANTLYARDLLSRMRNDSGFHVAQVSPVLQRLARATINGTYEDESALVLWRRVAGRYARQFAKAHGVKVVDVPTREALARMVRSEYRDAVTEKAATAKERARLKRVWSIGAIAYRNGESGHHFFDKKTLKFFGETLQSYRVHVSETLEISVTRRGPSNAGYREFVFNPTTGAVDPKSDAEG